MGWFGCGLYGTDSSGEYRNDDSTRLELKVKNGKTVNVLICMKYEEGDAVSTPKRTNDDQKRMAM